MSNSIEKTKEISLFWLDLCHKRGDEADAAGGVKRLESDEVVEGFFLFGAHQTVLASAYQTPSTVNISQSL